MLLQNYPQLHLTYCLNIHPGESWGENFAAIKKHVPAVRDQLAKDKQFGLGLRLSAQAARELADPRRMAEFRDFLCDQALYVFTINGFPYGQFHGTKVKENVYRPDWQDPLRRDYTILLADILAGLLPEGVSGSISTVPCSYKSWINSPQQVQAMAFSLANVAAHLAEINHCSGRDICLALEPEPDCYIGTVDEAVQFFQGPLLKHGTEHLASLGLGSAKAQKCIQRHLGICLDTAHAAVEFEVLTQNIQCLTKAGIRIGKIQLSAALSLEPTAPALTRLEDFVDTVYLHQVRSRSSDGTVVSYPDLPEALKSQKKDSSKTDELRVHFHVPLFCDNIKPLSSTAPQMTDEFWAMLRRGVTSHIEIETYTFGVLPKDLQLVDVNQSITREFEWVLQKLAVADQ